MRAGERASTEAVVLRPEASKSNAGRTRIRAGRTSADTIAGIPCLLLGALFLTGCRSVVETTIDADGSGELRTAIVYSAEDLANFHGAPGNAGKSLCDQHRQDAPPGSTVSEEEHEGETFCATSRTFANLRELRDLYGRIGGVSVEEMTFNWGVLTLAIEVDVPQGDGGESSGTEWRISMPGDLRAHNAERVDGSTLVWVIEPGEAELLQAESSVGLGPATLGPSGWLALLLLLAAVAGVLTIVVVRRPAFRP